MKWCNSLEQRLNSLTVGGEDVNNDGRPECLSTSTSDENIEAMKEIVMENRRNTIEQVAEDRRAYRMKCMAESPYV